VSRGPASERGVTALTATLLALFTAGVVLGNGLNWLERYFFGVRPGVVVAGRELGGFLRPEVERTVRAMAERLREPPVNASIDRDGVISPERTGWEVDVLETVDAIMNARPGERLHPIYVRIDPDITAKEIRALKRPIGSFATWVGGRPNRVHNVGRAASLVNYALLLPGEPFSFNARVGPATAARGFRPAPVIRGGTMVLEPGGGVCQVSSTLYNAVVDSSLEVLERNPHSRRVYYVPPGRDATVAYPYLDLKFLNSLDHPVLIRMWLSGRRLTAVVLGPGPVEDEPRDEAPGGGRAAIARGRAAGAQAGSAANASNG